MSPKLPRVTSSDVLSVLYRLGWERRRQSGSHVILRHPTKPGRVNVPAHRAKTLKPATLAAILDDAGRTAEEFGRLL